MYPGLSVHKQQGRICRKCDPESRAAKGAVYTKPSIKVTSSGSKESRAAHLVAAPLAVYMERRGVMQCRQCLQHKHTMVKSSATATNPWHEMI